MSPTKAGRDIGQAALTGWRNSEAVVSVRAGSSGWTELSYGQSGWSTLGQLPRGLTPVTDGHAIASVVDPADGNAIALLDVDGSVHQTTIPDADWARSWLGFHGLVPLIAEPGFLLSGASAIATIDDRGQFMVRDAPKAFVAVAPTSDPRTFLLATTADADEPGGLTASAPFDIYLWTIGSRDAPLLVAQRVSGISESSVSLAWIRADDGGWSALASTGGLRPGVAAKPTYTYISPDGKALLRLTYSSTGCIQESTDPCPVTLIDAGGSSREFDGPSSGADFDGGNIAFLLVNRPSLQLPWRLIVGPLSEPLTVPIG